MSDDQPFSHDWFSKPGDALRSCMQRQGVVASEVAELLPGGMDDLRGVLSGNRAIDQDIAEALVGAVGGSAKFWLSRQARYEDELERAVDIVVDFEADAWISHVPSPSGPLRGPLTPARLRQEVRRRLIFFNVGNFRSWEVRYGRLSESTRFRTSPSFDSKKSAALWWLRRGELEADLVTTRPWNPGNLKDRLEAIRRLSRLNTPARFLPSLRSLCAEAGVALVILRTPRGCHASGAARLVTSDKAMIMASFRYRADDHFWFTIFHEIGHLLLHGAETFVDEDDGPVDEVEREANEFASSCVIPISKQNEFGALPLNQDAILRFARSVGVSPGLVVGQMQHRQMIPHNRLNYLKRRWSWDQIEDVDLH